MDNIYKAVQLTIDSQNLALSKTPTHVYIANQYVDTNDTPLITAPFIIQKTLENGTGVVDIVSSTIGSIYEVRLLCDAEILISGYFYMPPMNVNFSELELYTSYPPRTPPVVNEFWQKTENFILEKTNTLLNFVQVFNSLSSMRLSLGYLEELATTKKSNLVSAINEVYKRYEGVGDLYEKNVEAGAGTQGWTDILIALPNDRTQRDKNQDFVTIKDFGAVCDGVTDDSVNLQKVLDTNANVIDGLGLTCKVNSSITIKPNQTLKNITLIAGTPGMNVVLVNTASKLLTSKIVGTGTINITERGIYPTADGVTDVVIDADISNLTVGVHAQPLTPTANITNSMIPARWNISGHIHDIVGKIGNSEGYGVLLSPAIACDINTRFTNIARHALYLSAGAAHNKANITCNDCNYIPVQIYATQTQRASQFNTIRGSFIGTKKSSAGNSTSIAIIGNSHNNDVSVSIESTGCENAIYIEGEGTANVTYPRNNKIHDNAITGSYTSSIINTVNGENSRIVNNNIYASWSAGAAIFTNVSGTANPTNSGYVDGNSIVGNGGTTNHGIANSSNAPVYVGINDVRNIAGATFIDYSTAKLRTGNLRQASGSVVTPSIASNATGDAVVTLPFTPVNQRVVLTKTANSSGNFNKANDAYAFISGNTLTIRAFNADTVAQTFTYSWLVLSD